MLGTLELENVRGFAHKAFEFGSRSVIVGNNGAGKSTVIEAVRILSVLKSFRTSRFDEIIRFDEPYMRLIGRYGEQKKEKVEFFYGLPFPDAAKERALSLNGKATEIMSYIGELPSVLFVPGDIDLIFGPPQLRRRYLDSVLWQVDVAFRQDYLDFSRVLRERSALLYLLKIRRSSVDELQPWDDLLEKLTDNIRQKRQALVAYIQKHLSEKKLNDLDFTVEYRSGATELSALRDQEIQSAQNLFGAHRDELEINLNDRSARRFASRGQARTAVILIKSIESQFLAQRAKREPLILLDDMFSELDEENSRRLFDLIEPSAQVILTALQTNPMLRDWQVVNLNKDGKAR